MVSSDALHRLIFRPPPVVVVGSFDRRFLIGIEGLTAPLIMILVSGEELMLVYSPSPSIGDGTNAIWSASFRIG